MPTVSAGDLTKLRGQFHATTLRMVVDVPPSIWTARVDGAHAAAVTQVRVKTVAQTMAPFTDCLIYFGTSAGANDLGESRFKQYSAPNLKVPPLPFALSDNDYVTVFNFIKPAAKIPKQQANSLVSEDNDTQYVDENTNFKPFANFGPPAVAWADPLTGVATVNFFDSSLAMATAATITTWAWVFPGGTPGTSALQGTSGAPIAVSFPIGRHYVKLTVTDSNGKTAAGFRVVWILDPANPPLATSKLEIGDIEGDVDGGGYSTSVLVHDVATSAVFPDGAMVIFHADDSYNGVAGSIGGQYRYRENIVMVGYIREGSLVRNWIDRTVEFKVDGIGVLMDNLAGVASNHVLTTGTPTEWHQFYNMVPDHIALHLVQEHSTVARVCDVKWTSLDFKLKYADLSEGSLRAQLSQIFASVRSRFGSSAQGMLFAEPIPNLLPLASRTQPKSIDIGLSDLRDDVELGTERYEQPVSQVQFFGFAYAQDSGGNWIEKPWNSLAPAVRYPTGSNQKIDGIRANSQTQANNLAGLYEGYLNNEFDEVVLHLRGNYRVFDIYPSEYLTLTVPAASNARGLDFNLSKFWIKRVSYSYKAGILLTDLVIEQDSFGAAGIDGPYPPGPGGCCKLPDGTQQEMSEDRCLALGGDWTEGPCQEPPSEQLGCCLLPDGSRIQATPTDCAAQGGTYTGDGPCPPIPPPPYPITTWASEVYLLVNSSVNNALYSGVYHTTVGGPFTGPGGAMPVWEHLTAGLPANPTYQWLQPDPYRSGTRQYVSLYNPASGCDEIYVRTGGAWSKIVDSDVLANLAFSVWGGDHAPLSGLGDALRMHIKGFQTDINTDSYIGVWTESFGQWWWLFAVYEITIYFYSTDYGATWNVMPIPSPFDSTHAPQAPGGSASTLAADGQIGDYAGASGVGGGQLIYTPLARPPNLYSRLYVSTDKGLHWLIIGPDPFDFTDAVFNTDVFQDISYFLGVTSGLRRGSTNGTVWSADLLPGGLTLGTSVESVYRFHTLFAPSSSYAQTIRVTDSGLAIWKSLNAGVSWAQTTPDATLGTRVSSLGISLLHSADGKLYGLDLGGGPGGSDAYCPILVSEDEGATWENKAGANAATAPYTDSIPGHAAVIAIVQVFN